MTFEEYLQDQHALEYIGAGDNMGEAFNEWLQDLEIDDWLNYGDRFNQKSIRFD